MATFFLILVYLAFISLGLPDSLLGAVWPAMGPGLSAPLEGAGAISLIITCGTILASLTSGVLIQKLGTGKVTCVSVSMTAAALLGFSLVPSFGWLCLAAVPLGLGAGAVDAALNQYVATHYAAKHMNWLHCFWGVGATAGPILLSACMAGAGGWRRGYLIISILQWTFAAILLISLPQWRKEREESGEATRERVSLRGRKRIGVTLFSFFCYCAIEASTGLWGSSYLTGARGLSPEQAAGWISLYYMGITAGRFLAGFATHKLSNKTLIRMGEGLCALGVGLLLLPLPTWFAMLGFALLGLGCAPIYPGMLHETPNRFGAAASQAMMGLQMAVAYIGNATIPPLFGLLAGKVGAGVLPVCLLLLVAGLTAATERGGRG